MATPLFITTKDLKQNTLINGSVDIDRFIFFIKISQEIHIQNFCGGKLFKKLGDLILTGDINDNANADYKNLIKDHLKDMLIHYAMIDYLPFSQFNIGNGGLFKNDAENTTAATKEEVDNLVQKHRDYAQFYTRRFIDFMSFNNSKFPEYNQNQNEDMYPDKNSNFHGIVL